MCMLIISDKATPVVMLALLSTMYISYMYVMCNLMNVLNFNLIAGGQLNISQMMPVNEHGNASILCANQNQYFRGTPLWKAPDGTNISSIEHKGFITTLAITRASIHQAGTYTCIVPGVPQVPEAKFDLIVHCKLQIMITLSAF